MLFDVRFALRQLAKSPRFTVVALLGFAPGIGVDVAMFARGVLTVSLRLPGTRRARGTAHPPIALRAG